jgi:hypothetical protein
MVLMAKQITRFVSVIAATATLGCTTGSESDDTFGGEANPGGGGSAGSQSSGGTTSSGGSTVVAGSGGSNSGGSSSNGECEAVSQQAVNTIRPVDILWAVDTTSSMQNAAQGVQDNLNTFAQFIQAQGIDVRVVMIARTGHSIPFGEVRICIEPPLGIGNCPTDDNNPPSFLKINNKINNGDALRQFIEWYPTYKPVLRPNSAKYFAIVTDDDVDADLSAAWFTPELAALNAQDGYFDVWKFFGIYCGKDPCLNPLLCRNDISAQEYTNLVNQTGGHAGNLCDPAGFGPVFDALADTVVGAASLDCEWTIPDAPQGQVFDKGKVNVKYTPGGGSEKDIFYVPSKADCDPVNGGWYYDDNDSPTKVMVCPSTCGEISIDLNGKIDVLFGCETILR